MSHARTTGKTATVFSSRSGSSPVPDSEDGLDARYRKAVLQRAQRLQKFIQEDTTGELDVVTDSELPMSDSSMVSAPRNQQALTDWYMENRGRTPPWSSNYKIVDVTPDSDEELLQIAVNPFLQDFPWSPRTIMYERRADRRRRGRAAVNRGKGFAVEAREPPIVDDEAVVPGEGVTLDEAMWDASNSGETDETAESDPSVVYGFSRGRVLADGDLSRGEEVAATGSASDLVGTDAVAEGNPPGNTESVAAEGNMPLGSGSSTLNEEGNQAPSVAGSANGKRSSYVIALDDEDCQSPKRRRRTIRMEIPDDRAPFQFKMIVKDVGRAIAIIGKVDSL